MSELSGSRGDLDSNRIALHAMWIDSDGSLVSLNPMERAVNDDEQPELLKADVGAWPEHIASRFAKEQPRRQGDPLGVRAGNSRG